MRKRKFAVGLDVKRLLEHALRKRTPFTITNQEQGQWQVYRAWLLAIQPNKLIFTNPREHRADIPLKTDAGREISVSFKKGYNKCIFKTRVIGPCEFTKETNNANSANYTKDTHTDNNNTETIQALAVYKPEQLEKIQRRSYDRAELPDDFSVEVTFWANNNPKVTWQGNLLNLSAGGTAIEVDVRNRPNLDENTYCYLEFAPIPEQSKITVQARFRHQTDVVARKRCIVGMQFVGLEADEQGLRTLRRISRAVSLYQRQLDNYATVGAGR
jgi:c-di-GMP-binding flagellar brake protein YcgR